MGSPLSLSGTHRQQRLRAVSLRSEVLSVRSSIRCSVPLKRAENFYPALTGVLFDELQDAGVVRAGTRKPTFLLAAADGGLNVRARRASPCDKSQRLLPWRAC